MKISIIICSRAEKIPDNQAENIKQTIGDVDYEVVAIDNHDNRYSIFQAYNEGVKRAMGDVLCFMHDDILFQTNGWGNLLESLFNDNTIDACSVIGSTYVRKAPSYTGHGKYNCKNWIQEDGHIHENADIIHPVITFDGMWFCIRKRCFEIIRFDDVTYSGFHFYDMDTGVQLYQAGFKTVFVPGIDIFHPIGGDFNLQWLLNSYAFYNKWKHVLPLSTNTPPIGMPTQDEQYEFELRAIYSSLRLIVKYRQFHLLKAYRNMTREVLHCSALKATKEALLYHRRLKKKHQL